MANKLAQLESTLKENEELAAKYKEALASAKEAGMKSDVEALAFAAKAVGVEISISQIEADLAQAQSLSDDDLNLVSGGVSYEGEGEDEYGHDLWCVTIWHCYTISAHTETEHTAAACFNDYTCYFAWYDD